MKVSWKREKLFVAGARGAWSYTLTLPDGAVVRSDGFATKRAARSHAQAEAAAWWAEHQDDTTGAAQIVRLPGLGGKLHIERLVYARAYTWRLYAPGGGVVADGIQSSVRKCEVDAQLESVNARVLLEDLLGAVDVSIVLEQLVDGSVVEVGDVRFAPSHSSFRAGRWTWRVGDESGIADDAAHAVLDAHAAGQVVHPEQARWQALLEWAHGEENTDELGRDRVLITLRDPDGFQHGVSARSRGGMTVREIEAGIIPFVRSWMPTPPTSTIPFWRMPVHTHSRTQRPYCARCGDTGLVRPRDARDTSDMVGCPVCNPDPADKFAELPF